MENQWKITEDKINETIKTESGEYTFGTEINTTSGTFTMGVDLPVRFKMYDDDGELYLEGRMQIEDFHPLDDLGTPSYGCTEIKTSIKGRPFTTL